MTYRIKYVAPLKYTTRPKHIRGVKPKDEHWGSEEAIIAYDKRYAWHKHKAQAKYRGEEHNLSLEDWFELWPNELWLLRGRNKDDYSMYKLDPEKPWTKDNVCVGLRSEYLTRVNEYKAIKNA